MAHRREVGPRLGVVRVPAQEDGEEHHHQDRDPGGEAIGEEHAPQRGPARTRHRDGEPTTEREEAILPHGRRRKELDGADDERDVDDECDRRPRQRPPDARGPLARASEPQREVDPEYGDEPHDADERTGPAGLAIEQGRRPPRQIADETDERDRQRDEGRDEDQPSERRPGDRHCHLPRWAGVYSVYAATGLSGSP
jgi:hypothetical protein